MLADSVLSVICHIKPSSFKKIILIRYGYSFSFVHLFTTGKYRFLLKGRTRNSYLHLWWLVRLSSQCLRAFCGKEIDQKITSRLTEKYLKPYSVYYLLSRRLYKTIEAIDSVQKLADSKMEAVNYKSYALARIDEKVTLLYSENCFQTGFIHKLSFNEQLHSGASWYWAW